MQAKQPRTPHINQCDDVFARVSTSLQSQSGKVSREKENDHERTIHACKYEEDILDLKEVGPIEQRVGYFCCSSVANLIANQPARTKTTCTNQTAACCADTVAAAAQASQQELRVMHVMRAMHALEGGLRCRRQRNSLGGQRQL